MDVILWNCVHNFRDCIPPPPQFKTKARRREEARRPYWGPPGVHLRSTWGPPEVHLRSTWGSLTLFNIHPTVYVPAAKTRVSERCQQRTSWVLKTKQSKVDKIILQQTGLFIVWQDSLLVHSTVHVYRTEQHVPLINGLTSRTIRKTSTEESGLSLCCEPVSGRRYYSACTCEPTDTEFEEKNPPKPRGLPPPTHLRWLHSVPYSIA